MDYDKAENSSDHVDVKFSMLDILRMLTGLFIFYCCVCRSFTGNWYILPFKKTTIPVSPKETDIPRYWYDKYGQFPVPFSMEDLLTYTGSSNSSKLLLSVKGHVFDVSRGSRFYGKWGPYRKFTGTDCSRLFSYPQWDLSALSKECSYDLSNLTSTELKRVDSWLQFFQKKYPEIGYVVELSP